ncbi:hypothetical protein BDW62DRAFT_101482 [Aspergillus aurantiobrunneus]
MSTSNFISTTKLHNTRVLVIGGTSGVGFAVARASLEHGASVILASSNPERVQNAISKLKALYPEEPYVSRIAGKPCDLSNEETVEDEIVSLFKFATARDLFPSSSPSTGTGDLVPINHIVITAGTIPPILLPTDPSVNATYLRSMNTVRFTGGALVAKHAPKYMPSPRTSSSSLTYTSGVLVERPRPGYTYGVAAAMAVEGLARGLAVDLAPIRVNVVMLGPVKTEIFNSLGDEKTVEEVLRGYGEATLLGEVAMPGDVAESYLGLMRDRFVTGAMVKSDGGFMLKFT